jgi:DNA repair photolyase
MVDLVPARSNAWDQKGGESIGLNKTACFLNRRSNGRSLKEWAPISLLKGETVGFQGIQDPFDPRWKDDLLFLLKNSKDFAGILLATKWPKIPQDVIEALKEANATVMLSITGADLLEPGSTTQQRLNVAKKLIEHGVNTHCAIHPWIAGVSSIEWIERAKEIGLINFTVKGFRWTRLMGDLGIPKKYLDIYKENEGEEILLDPPKIKSISFPRFQGNISKEEAIKSTKQIAKIAVISSSATTEEVIKATINRRATTTDDGKEGR